MRTQDEIVARVYFRRPQDFFGFETADLVAYLDFAHARQFLKPEVTEAEWVELNPESHPATEIREYMPFAWEKANDCRGISAYRSISHMKAWLWMDGKDALVAKMESEYEFYGKPCLVLVCQEYGIDWRALDNGRWVKNEDDPPWSAEDGLKKHGIELEKA